MWPIPKPGTIMWCKFPERPRDAPGPKPRPVLVMEVSEEDCAVKVAYGTSQHLNQLYSGEFAIRKQQHLRAFLKAGLSVDTKFNLGHALVIPYNKEYFVSPSSVVQSPVLGIIDESLLPMVEAAFKATLRR